MNIEKNINTELIKRVSDILKDYSTSEVIVSLWYLVLSINMTIIKDIDNTNK